MHLHICFTDSDTLEINFCFFSLQDLPSQDAHGIFNAIKNAFKEKDLFDLIEKIVFLASDGASVNTGLNNGLIKFFQDEMPWIGFVWCIAHRLELSIKDALETWIKPINTNLRNLYYMYEKSSKKTRELKELFEVLNDIFIFENQEVKPHRATGTRWIAHKLKALQNYIDKFGLYVSDIENVIADTSKKTDKAPLQGKLKLLTKSSTFLLSCVLFDLLQPVGDLSLQTQKDENNLINTIDMIENTHKRYIRLKEKLEINSELIFSFPCSKKIMSELKNTDGKYFYQDVLLKEFEKAKQYLKGQVFDIVNAICKEFDFRFGTLQDRDNSFRHQATSDDTLVHDIAKVLNTKAWSENGNHQQIISLRNVFKRFESMPSLKELNLQLLEEEYEQIIDYALKYHANFRQIDQKAMWDILFEAVGKDQRFKSIFEIIKLCFCVPYSNAKVERLFNYMKVIKTDWRSRLNAANLESLIRIKVEGPDLSEFANNHCLQAVKLWWEDKQRRISKGKRSYAQRSGDEKRVRFNNEFIDDILGESSEDEV